MNNPFRRPGRRLKRYGLASVVALGLAAGCASMSEDECVTADWEMIGYEDGAAGLPAARISHHRKACADHGVTPDMAAYRHGRDQGLSEYCRPDKGYQLGRQGHGYSGECPADVAEQFAAAYGAGREIYDLESSIRRTEGHIRRRESELVGLRNALKHVELELVNSDTSSDRRVELLIETHEIVRKQGTLESEIDHLRHDVAWKREQLTEIKAGPATGW